MRNTLKDLFMSILASFLIAPGLSLLDASCAGEVDAHPAATSESMSVPASAMAKFLGFFIKSLL